MGVQIYLIVSRQASPLESSVCWCVIVKPGGGSVQGSGCCFFNRRSIGRMCVKSCSEADVGRAEVRSSTGLRAKRREIEPTTDRPRRLRQPSTGVPQLTHPIDDFGNQVSGYHNKRSPQTTSATKYRGTTNTSDHNACNFEVSHTYGLLYALNPVFLGVQVRVSAVQYPYDPLSFILESK